jgi:hypothetical protein
VPTGRFGAMKTILIIVAVVAVLLFVVPKLRRR